MTATYQNLLNLIHPDRIYELDVTTKADALKEMSQRLAQDPRILDGQAFYESMIKREEQASTGVGLGIAIPHVKIPEVADYVMAVGRVKQGIEFKALDGKPVHLIFMIAASHQQTREFVKILRDVTHLLKCDQIREQLMQAQIPTEFYSIIEAALS